MMGMGEQSTRGRGRMHMLAGFLGSVGAICGSCTVADTLPVSPGALAPEVFTVQSTDGCTRFALRVDDGIARVEELTNTTGCSSDGLQLLADSQPIFDAGTGVLRVPVRLRNNGSSSIVAPVRVRFVADSAQFVNAQGQVIAGTPNIVAINYDSAHANGRNGIWRFDTLLAPSGQPQVLPANATTARKWLEFSGTSWSQRIRIKLPMGAKLQTHVVPAVPPDTVPAGLYSPVNIVDDSLFTGGPILKDVLTVVFIPAALQQGRQALIDSIGGVVIGGGRTSSTTGYYYIRIVPPPTLTQLHAFVARLRASPIVDEAAVVLAVDVPSDYLLPLDGAGWTSWQLNPSYSGSGNREALGRLRAPLAWGCSIGDAAAAVAVVDTDLRSSQDLAFNSSLSSGVGSVNTSIEHGTRVASILAARGNNGAGMVGVMWKSDLRGYERSSNGSLGLIPLAQSLERAIRDGARVVNLSSSFAQAWTSIPSSGRVTWHGGSRLDSSYVRAIDSVYQGVMRRVVAAGYDPVLAFPAGNFTSIPAQDAYWSGNGTLKSLYPGNVLVVGSGSLTASTLANSSGRGARVTIAALGESVYSATQSAPEGSPASGTSFAAPQVAGISGLLLGFNPQLTATEIVQLIEQGAVLAGRTSSGIPLANAYESLKLAASRKGAPLCGNRVWSGNGYLIAERSQNGATFTDDTLAAVGTNAHTWVNVFHGGRRIQNYRTVTPGWREFLWTAPGTWTPQNATTSTDTIQGGTFTSSYAWDHDEKRQFYVTGAGTPSAPQFALVRADQGSAPVTVATVPGFRVGIDSSTAGACYAFSSSMSCVATYYPIVSSRVITTIAPEGDRGFVAIQRLVTSAQAGAPGACRASSVNPAFCAPYTTTTDLVGSTSVYEVDLQSGATSQRWSTSDQVFLMGVSERNDELVASEGVHRPQFTYSYDSSSGNWQATASGTAAYTCAVTYRSILRPATTGAIRRAISVEPLTGCDAAPGGMGGGTIAPRVAGVPAPRSR